MCVRASCTIKQSLSKSSGRIRHEKVSLTVTAAKAFLQTLLGAPRRNKESLGTFTTLIVGGVAILAYFLRVAARLPGSSSKWGLDDWALTLAMLFIIPLTICAYVCKCCVYCRHRFF
jgi:hypothetical protein